MLASPPPFVKGHAEPTGYKPPHLYPQVTLIGCREVKSKNSSPVLEQRPEKYIMYSFSFIWNYMELPVEGGMGGSGLRTQTKGGNRAQSKDFDWIDLPVLVCRW